MARRSDAPPVRRRMRIEQMLCAMRADRWSRRRSISGYAWRRQAHKERAPLGAACVADCPVSALFAAAGKVAAADVFGPCA